MYKFKKTNLLISAFLLLSVQTYNVKAFSFREMFEEMDHTFHNIREELKTRFHQQELTPEDQALIKEQLELVTKLKPEIIKKDNGDVTITFPINGIDKTEIALSLEHGLLHGTIPLKYGDFKFIVYPKFIRYDYLIEINKDIKQQAPITSQEEKTEGEAKEKETTEYNQKFYWRTSNYFTEALPLEVDVTKVKSETKDNKFVIELKPKSYTKVKIQHN